MTILTVDFRLPICNRGETPTPKLQTPKNHQASSSEIGSTGSKLKLGYWNFSGAWMLVLGACLHSVCLNLRSNRYACRATAASPTKPTTRSRNALACCKASASECRAVLLPFSCFHDTAPALAESCFAPHRQDSGRRAAAVSRAPIVAGRSATAPPPGALSRRSGFAGPGPPHIQWGFAIRAHFPAMSNQVVSETHPARSTARACRVVGRIVSRKVQPAAEYLVF